MKAQWKQWIGVGVVLAVSTSLLAGCAVHDPQDDEPVGEASRPILGGKPLDPNGGAHVQLVGCSGHLLDNEWLITARSCGRQYVAKIELRVTAP